jgi:uncharacterized protein YaiE (UPF0345 family)
MADVPGKFYRATKVRTGVAPSSAGSIEGEVLPPVNPPGSSLNSVGLTMPSAFTVSNSPLTANGTIGVAGAGTVSQYIRGDGSLADFPESSGGGSSVSYYLNGSVNQGTIGGVAYRELNKVPILGAGTDFTINADGYIASFITDAGDPSLLEIPGGNWNFETYFSASSSGGTPTFYVELYKVSGTTATLIASSSSAPELIAFGTNLTPYFSTLAVPTTTLALTDRLAVRYYVTHSGRTITLHTENNHLCQIITTFTTGLTALNGLTAQVQNFAVGTTGTDFNIASATATHTFNLPTASATNRGALSSADWSLFTQAYNDKINSAAVTGTTTKTLTLTQQDGGTITASWSDLNTDAVLSVFGRTGAVVAANGDYTTAQVTESGNLYYTEARVNANANVAANTAARHNAVTLGTANGLSLSTQVLSLGLASAGVTGALSGSDWSTFNSKQNALTLTTTGTSGAATLVGATLNIPQYQAAGTYVTSVTASSPLFSSGGTTPNITIQQASSSQSGFLSSTDWTTFNNKQNALTNPVTGTGTTNYLPKFTGSTTIGNSALYDGGSFGGFNSTGLAARTFVINAASGRPLALELIENANVHAIYFRPNNSGYNLISSNYISGGVYLPLSLSARENNADLVLATSGNLLVGTTTDNGARLQVSGTSTFSSTLRTLGDFYAASGTSTAASIRFWDANSGLYHPGSDALGFITSGTQKMVILANGNVGIGTLSPTFFSGNTTLAINNAAGGAVLELQSNGTSALRMATSSSDSALWEPRSVPVLFGTANTPRMTITSGGNVGIGTLSPTGGKLQVNNGTNLNVGINTTTVDSVTTSRISSFNDAVSASVGLVINGTPLVFTTSDTERMHITTGGNVLIGTTTDNGQRLQVSGNLSSTGDILVKGTYNPYTATNRGNITLNGTSSNILGFANNTTTRGYILHDGTDLEIVNQSSGVIHFFTSSGEAMRINSGLSILTYSSLNVGGSLDAFTIRTLAPTGSNTEIWRLGRALLATSSDPEDRWIRVQLGNRIYDILAIDRGAA